MGDDSVLARDQLLEGFRFGVSSNFPITCMHHDFPPINNSAAGPGNIIEWELGRKENTFMDPQFTFGAFRFQLNPTVSTNAFGRWAFDYNSEALIAESNLYINGTQIYNLKELHRINMILEGYYGAFPYVGSIADQLALSGTNATGTSVVQATNCSNINLSKNTNGFFGQMHSKRRSGIPMYAFGTYLGTGSKAIYYALAHRYPDFIIGKYAKKFVWLDALKSIHYRMTLEQGYNCLVQTHDSSAGASTLTLGTIVGTPSSTYIDNAISYTIDQYRVFTKLVTVTGGQLNQLLQEAYVETSIPQIIQSATSYLHLLQPLTASSGSIQINAVVRGLKTIIVTFNRTNDNNVYNYYLTNNVGGFYNLQCYIRNNLLPMSKYDYSQYPYDEYSRHHGFALGEPQFSSNNDSCLPLDTVPQYTNSTGVDGVNAGWGAFQAPANGKQSDTWNTVADVYNWSRTNTVLQWTNDDPNLYDHEFQEAKIDIETSDIRIDYNMSFGVGATSAATTVLGETAATAKLAISSESMHIYLFYGSDVRTNKYEASVINNS
jgi:hypothetical protein